MPRGDVSLVLRESASWISAMAIGATEYDVRCFVHRLAPIVTLQTASALRVSFRLRLINPPPPPWGKPSRHRDVWRNRGWWPERLLRLLPEKNASRAKQH